MSSINTKTKKRKCVIDADGSLRKQLTLRLLLRSVYLKGSCDARAKTCDMSWEDTVVADINELFE